MYYLTYRIYKWCSRHKWVILLYPAFYLLIMISGALPSFSLRGIWSLSTDGEAIQNIVLGTGAAFLLALGFVGIIDASLLSCALKIRTAHCDPDFLLAETAEQLQTTKPGRKAEKLWFNYTAALLDKGMTKEVFPYYQSCPYETYSFFWRFAYEVNIACCYIRFKDVENAQRHLDSAQLLYDTMVGKRLLKQFLNAILLNRAEILCLQGDYTNALSLLTQCTPKTQLEKVEHSFLNAKVMLELGRRQEAAFSLDYTIAYSGKMAIRDEAIYLRNSLYTGE